MSNIDVTKPVYGEASTQSVRLNFTAAKTEIEALQAAIAAIDVPAGGFLPIDGSVSMTGPLILADDATDPLGAVTKRYVDDPPLRDPPIIALIRDRIRAAAISNPRTNAPMATSPKIYVGSMWVANRTYALDDAIVTFTGISPGETAFLYRCTTAGTTASTGAGPTGTNGAITDGTVVWAYVNQRPSGTWGNAAANSYLWLGRAGDPTTPGVINFLGGSTFGTLAGSGGAEVSYSTTVEGVLGQSAHTRYRFITDDICPVVRFFAGAPGEEGRLIIDGHYVSRTPFTNNNSAVNYMFIDFGTQKSRDIIVEASGWFPYGVDVLLTSTVRQPTPNPLTFVMTGDSIGYGASATNLADCFFDVACDLLGAQNYINTAIGGCGYLQNTGGGAPPPAGSGLAIDRIDDVLSALAAHPNAVVIDENGFNDTLFTQAEIQAACSAYIAAIRASYPKVPIIELGIFSGAQGTMSQRHVDAENAKKAAVNAARAAGDKYIWFVPLMTGVGGPLFTGDGNDQTPNGTGNSDIYVYGGSLPHPNTAGHAYYAAYLADAIRAIFLPTEQYSQTEAGGLFLPLTGGTISGPTFVDAALAVTRGPLYITAPHADSTAALTIANDGSANPGAWPSISFSKKKNANMAALISGQTDGLLRWDIFLGDNSPENGANSGSDLSIRAWDDAAGTATYPLAISRATGLITVHGDPVDPLGIATMRYVNARMTARAFMQFDPAAPGATASATEIMMGLAAVITPNVSGKVSVSVTGNVNAGPAGAGCYIFLQYGTGTPPPHGAAVAGTNSGVAQFTAPTDSAVISFTKQAALNLTVGTAYWIDLAVQCYFGATASLTTITITAVEQ